ncbi:MAG: alpha-glucuronidase, partial [Clostridiales bacterium]|nr:alpha-glucuronidase [Clostridiales bacterium]
DWRDTETDRPKAPYELFKPQDGLFDENVILQIKNGPSDFQVREPLSPLFGAIDSTAMCLELQITQEYTGQQRDVYNLATQWEEVYSFPLDKNSSLRDIAGKKIIAQAGVSSVGLDKNWTGHTLAQCNLYAFGRLAWNPALTADQITREWIKLTFGTNKRIVDVISHIMTNSRAVYEKYNTPLGLCWMVSPEHHYGPSPEGYEYMKWGTYHRANREAVGIDRTRRGTGFAAQYTPYLTEIFDDKTTCPEEYLLYFHRLRYDCKLKDGRTLLQRIYDDHFEGADAVRSFIEEWKTLENLLKSEKSDVYHSVLNRLYMQLENAIEWRDVINTYFYRFTGVPDEKGREIYP